MEKTRISIVSYLNSKPFLFGLKNSPVINEIDISLDIPSKVASKLAFNLADIGLIPVAGLDDLDAYRIVSNYCIGSVGKVRTVIIASEVPIERIDTILMDYQSRSSVLLSKVLAKFYWNRDFNWENTCTDFENISIKGNTAGVVIGDRVFDVESKYRYIYDLSEEWLKFTGLPFVFAVWAANKTTSPELEKKLNFAFESGLENISEIVEKEKAIYPEVDINDYFTNNISFVLDDAKRKGMQLFLDLARKLEPVQL